MTPHTAAAATGGVPSPAAGADGAEGGAAAAAERCVDTLGGGGQRRWTQIRSNYRKTNRFFCLQHKPVVFLTVLLLDGGKLSREEKNPKKIPVCNLCVFLILQGFLKICLYF